MSTQPIPNKLSNLAPAFLLRGFLIVTGTLLLANSVSPVTIGLNFV